MRKLGINYGAERPQGMTDEERLCRLAEYGFGAIFTGIGKPEAIDALAPKVRAAGIDYDFIHAPFDGINHIWAEGEQGDTMLDRLITVAETCARNDIPIMVIHLSSGDNAPCVNDFGIARFDALVKKSGELGVKIAIENQRKIGNIACLMERYLGESHVGFCWDNGHEACYAYGREYMPWFGDRLICLHIHDNLKIYNGDSHYLPFDGLIDFSHVADQIRESGYTGTLMLETGGRGNPLYAGLTDVDFLKRAYMQGDRLRRMIDGE